MKRIKKRKAKATRKKSLRKPDIRIITPSPSRRVRKDQRLKIKSNLPPLSSEARTNLRKVIDFQTNDELIESLNRLKLKTPYIDEYMRTISSVVRPINVQAVFDRGERTARGIAMTMLYVTMRMCKPVIDALGMSKRTLRLPDWDKKKFSIIETGDMDKETPLLKLVYEMRIKKGF